MINTLGNKVIDIKSQEEIVVRVFSEGFLVWERSLNQNNLLLENESNLLLENGDSIQLESVI